jgi:hypothetical protein
MLQGSPVRAIKEILWPFLLPSLDASRRSLPPGGERIEEREHQKIGHSFCLIALGPVNTN